jgi:predicted dehydrogenase
LTGQVELFVPGGKEWTELFCHQHQRDDSYLAEWNHFLSCVSGASQPLVSGEDGLRVVEIIEAALTSSLSGCLAQVSKNYEPKGN